MNKYLILCFIFILSGYCDAETSKIDRRPAIAYAYGVGTHSCGKYLEERRLNDEPMKYLYQQWGAGYLAGYSSAITKPGKTVNIGTDLDNITAWLDKWCGNDPTSNVYAGLIALKNKLEKNQQF